MSDAVIVAAARTPIGTARKGSLLDVTTFELARYAAGEALKRSGIPAGDVDDMQMGESLQGGGCVARYAAIELGLIEVPGLALNRHCASGMGAVQGAAASIIAGMDTVAIAGGSESMSTTPTTMKRTPYTDDWAQWMSPSHPEQPDAPAFDMSITVGLNTAKALGLTRQDCDEWAVRSHQRAIQAIDEGRFEEEIIPIEVKMRDGSTKIFSLDEHPRRDSTMEKMSSLKPLHPEIEGFPITADYAKANGLTPMAKIVSWASTGTNPRDTGLGPILSIPKALDRAGLQVSDVNLAEINEAFASVPVAACRQLGLSEDITNVSGSGCSLGHPVACTGARMIITTMYELRRRGGGIGLASMCAGGGMGSTTVFEVYPG
jgi:acetyl-CoA C-acetyltransferase